MKVFIVHSRSVGTSTIYKVFNNEQAAEEYKEKLQKIQNEAMMNHFSAQARVFQVKEMEVEG